MIGAATLPARLTLSGRLGWLRTAAILVAALIAVPIVGITFSLFEPTDDLAHLWRTLLPRYLETTVWLVLGVAAGTLAIGVSTAWLVTTCSFPFRRIFEWALVLPFAIPAYVLAYVYTDFLHHPGMVQTALREVTGWGPRDYWFPNIRSLGGAIFVFSLAFYPYVYLFARTAFLQQSAGVLEASRSLGCTPFAGFRRVALPLARPAIVAGLALALMETLADFGAVSHFGVQTFTTGIYKSWFSLNDKPLAGWLSAALLIFVFGLLAIERSSRAGRRFHETRGGRLKSPKRFQLSPGESALAFSVCAVPVILGFLLPVGLLIHLSVSFGHTVFDTRYLTLAANSITLGALAALLTVPLALILAYRDRLWPGRAGSLMTRVAGMGYAVPGTVIAVGVLIPLTAFGNFIDGVMRETFGVSTGLLFTGTIVALLYAYVVRFLTVPLQSADAGLQKVTKNMEAAARSLGAGPTATLTRVHAPILKGGLLTAALIVFVDVIKELPATLILRPFNFDTLAIQAYRLASDERLAEASTASLAIVAAGLVPVIILSRTISGSRPGGDTYL